VFRQAICVPGDYIAATLPQQRACRSMKGLAGKKRLKIMKSLKSNKKIVDSKIKYMIKGALEQRSLLLPVLLSYSDKEIKISASL
jgi:hypothetical protein